MKKNIFALATVLAAASCATGDANTSANHVLNGATLHANAGPVRVLGLTAPAVENAPYILFNQVGFLPNGVKRAIVRSTLNTPIHWQLRNKDNHPVLEGDTRVFGDNPTSGDKVHILDFTAYNEIGDGYQLVLCQTSRTGAICPVRSRPFKIASETYRPLARAALNYFYHARIGIPIEAQYTGGAQYTRPISQDHMRATCFHGTDMHGQTWPGCDYQLDVSGGWQDAGDYGVYPVNMGVSIWALQSAYERLESQGPLSVTGWQDGAVALPENGASGHNGASEILDEARYGLEEVLRLQIPNGKKAQVPVGRFEYNARTPLALVEIDAGGMVHHRLASANWPPVPTRPIEDTRERFLYPTTTAATLALAATGAQAARLWRGIDAEFSARCLAAARRAYAAALANPEVYGPASFDGSGAYGDFNVSDEFIWAASELYRTTGEAQYKDRMMANAGAFSNDAVSMGWNDVRMMASITWAINVTDGPNRALVEAAQRNIVRAADQLLSDRDKEGYQIPFTAGNYNWGSNGEMSNRAIVLASANDITADPKYRDGVIDAADYMLGRNVVDQSYLSGFGARPMRAPHHRFWHGAVDPAYPMVPPGVLSGGANSSNMADEVARNMSGHCVPMACYADDYRAYALNEVAINWNAPFVWVMIWLDQQGQAGRERGH